MRRLTPAQIGLAIAGILILAFVAWTATSTRRENPDKLKVSSTAAAPEKRCGSQATYDLIKRELFRRGAALRGSDEAAFGKLAAYSVVRIDRPLLDSHDEETGAINCSGTLTLDLPPGVAVVGGRRTLKADIGFALQGSADGNGQVLTLTRADAIVTPLATLARAAAGSMASAPDLGELPSASLDPRPVPGVDQGDSMVPVAQAPVPPPAPSRTSPPTPAIIPSPTPAPARTATAKPSFNCANARTRGEIAVCRDSGLAALDRQMSGQYYSAVRSADGDTRALLQRSRNRFLVYRDQCPSNACIAQTYRGRMREIRDIASGRLP